MNKHFKILLFSISIVILIFGIVILLWYLLTQAKHIQNLKLNKLTDNYVELQWEDYPYSTSYMIKDEKGNFVADNVVGNQYRITKLSPERKYQFFVVAKSWPKHSLATTISFQTHPKPTFIEHLKILHVQQNSAKLCWKVYQHTLNYQIKVFSAPKQEMFVNENVVGHCYDLNQLKSKTLYRCVLIAQTPWGNSLETVTEFTTK